MVIKIVIQARLGSTRLPNKVLLPFWNDETILDIIIKNLNQLSYPIILATSIDKTNDPLEQFSEQYNIELYRGDEENVIQRFLDATEVEEPEFIIRVCADNPFIDVLLIKELLEFARLDNYKSDYYSFCDNETPTILTHFGVFVELVRRESLSKVMTMTTNQLYREHVTNYIYQHPKSFKIALKEIEKDGFLPENTRLTVDTKSDFMISKNIYSTLKSENKEITVKNLSHLLENDAGLLNQMKQIISSNKKK